MTAEVHLVAGLNGAGKTTFARQLAVSLPGVRFGLDEWMIRLHGLSFDNDHYPELAERCRDLIWDTAAQVLAVGLDVIMDWNMWSRARRADAVQRAAELGSRCQLHYLRVPLDIAVRNAERRRDPHSHALDAAAIGHLESLFEEPTESEGFILHVIDHGDRT